MGLKITLNPYLSANIFPCLMPAESLSKNKNISLTYETKSIIPMQKNKFTKVITNSIIKDFSNQF